MPFSKKDIELDSQDLSDQDTSDDVKDSEENDEENSRSVTGLSTEDENIESKLTHPDEDTEQEPQNQV